MGGRPSVPITPDPGVWDPSVTDEHLHLLNHWEEQARRTADELNRWKAFRKYQNLKRQSKDAFEDYKRYLDGYLIGQGISWTLQVDEAIGRQGKLDEWKEFYIYAHRRLGQSERQLESVRQLPKWEQQLESRLCIAEINVEQQSPVFDWIRDQLPLVAAETVGTEESQPTSNRRTRSCHKRRSARIASRLPVAGIKSSQQGLASKMSITQNRGLNSVQGSRVSKIVQRSNTSKSRLQSSTTAGKPPLVARSQQSSTTHESQVCDDLVSKRRTMGKVKGSSSLPEQDFRLTKSRCSSSNTDMRRSQPLIARKVFPATGPPLRRSVRLRQLKEATTVLKMQPFGDR